MLETKYVNLDKRGVVENPSEMGKGFGVSKSFIVFFSRAIPLDVHSLYLLPRLISSTLNSASTAAVTRIDPAATFDDTFLAQLSLSVTEPAAVMAVILRDEVIIHPPPKHEVISIEI